MIGRGRALDDNRFETAAVTASHHPRRATDSAHLHRRSGPAASNGGLQAEPLGNRFRRPDDKGRARDPDLKAAQSQLIAAKSLAAAYFAHDPVAAAAVGAKQNV